MEESRNGNNGKTFYGRFTLIYAVLNIAAFFILLLTTEWSVLADDEWDGFWIGFLFLVIGIAAALIHGIWPAIMLKRKGYTKRLWLFPLVVMLAGFVVFPFEPFALTIGLFLIFPLGCPLFNCFAYNSDPQLSMTSSYVVVSIAPAAIYALVILITLLSMRGANGLTGKTAAIHVDG